MAELMHYKGTAEEISPAWKKFLQEAKMKPEIAEIEDEFYAQTGYPAPEKSYRLIVEGVQGSIEHTYYWFLSEIRQNNKFPYIDKLVDSYAASETSSFWGNATQRLNMQQEKAGNYLRVISELIKQLFQIVRELRMIDEKLNVRQAWSDPETGEKLKSADVTLKSEFVELVEGGAKDVNSVYGLAREVGYSILPDLFFNTHIYKSRDIDKVVDKMQYNLRVKNVLKKKLYNFINWKKSTDKEFNARRDFELKYLYQHWQTIRAYMQWLSPYLRNIKRLTMKSKFIKNPDIVLSFETAMSEIEILAWRPIVFNGKPTKVNYCTIVNFTYSTRPDMNFHTPDYGQKGPVHSGKCIVNFKGYVWSDEQIKKYKKYKEEEDLELLGLADQKVQSAIDMLGDTFKKYLAECGENITTTEDETPKKKKPKQDSILTPFLGIFKAFGDFGSAAFPSNKDIEKFKAPQIDPNSINPQACSVAKDRLKFAIYSMYKNYKKAHKMLSW